MRQTSDKSNEPEKVFEKVTNEWDCDSAFKVDSSRLCIKINISLNRPRRRPKSSSPNNNHYSATRGHLCSCCVSESNHLSTRELLQVQLVACERVELVWRSLIRRQSLRRERISCGGQSVCNLRMAICNKLASAIEPARHQRQTICQRTQLSVL